MYAESGCTAALQFFDFFMQRLNTKNSHILNKKVPIWNAKRDKNTKRRNIRSPSNICCIHVNQPDICVQTFIYMVFKQTIYRICLPYVYICSS